MAKEFAFVGKYTKPFPQRTAVALIRTSIERSNFHVDQLSVSPEKLVLGRCRRTASVGARFTEIPGLLELIRRANVVVSGASFEEDEKPKGTNHAFVTCTDVPIVLPPALQDAGGLLVATLNQIHHHIHTLRIQTTQSANEVLLGIRCVHFQQKAAPADIQATAAEMVESIRTALRDHGISLALDVFQAKCADAKEAFGTNGAK